MARDLLVQGPILRGIAAVDSGSENGDRPSARLDGTSVGRSVDAPGETAHHDDPFVGEESRQLAGAAEAMFGGATRSDQRHPHLLRSQQADVAPAVERLRSVPLLHVIETTPENLLRRLHPHDRPPEIISPSIGRPGHAPHMMLR